MEIKNVKLDTDDLTFEEVNDLIQELRNVRIRKDALRSKIRNFNALLDNAKDEEMVFVNRHTGEILKAKDWALFDKTTLSIYPVGDENK